MYGSRSARSKTGFLTGIAFLGAVTIVGTTGTAQAWKTRNCASYQLPIVNAAATLAQNLLNQTPPSYEFDRWFGIWPNPFDPQGLVATSIVFGIQGYALSSLHGVNGVPEVTFDCAGGRQSIVAHNKGVHTTEIFLDVPFWNVPDRPDIQHISKASTIIHELTHLAGTQDFATQMGMDDWIGANYFVEIGDWPLAVWSAPNYEYYFLNLQ
jgi:hypothetical protein